MRMKERRAPSPLLSPQKGESSSLVLVDRKIFIHRPKKLRGNEGKWGDKFCLVVVAQC